MNVFSFVLWNKYFHEVKDEMYHSSRLCLVEEHFIFHLMKIFVPLHSETFIICIILGGIHKNEQLLT